MTTENNDLPWQHLRTPAVGTLTVQRANPGVELRLQWGIDSQRIPRLIAQLKSTNAGAIKAPTLAGLSITTVPETSNPNRTTLFIALNDRTKEDIFAVFCRDIIDVASTCETEELAVQRIMKRVWRWHRLLSGTRKKRLSLEEQAGLFAELHVLENLLFPIFGWDRSVEAWVGQSAGVQDFDFGPLRIESKALIAAQRRNLKINSAEQLSWDTSETMILQTVDLAIGSADDPEAIQVSAYALRLFHTLETDAPHACSRLLTKLYEAGVDPFCDDLSEETPWVVEETPAYHVREGFPCLLRSSLPHAILSLNYTIDRRACDEFHTDEHELRALLERYK